MTDKKIDYNASSSPESDQDVGEIVQIETTKDGEYHRTISARQMHVSSIQDTVI
jgi:hypothetical protein